MAEVRIKDIDDHDIDTILADDIDFEGKLTFKKPLMIRGKFRGEINSPSALYVGEKAVLEAKIEAGLVSSKGRIKGDIVGHNRVELASTANVEGDITTPDFVVESGCKFNGYCNMGTPKRQATAGQSGGQAAPGHGQQPTQAHGPQSTPAHGQSAREQPAQAQPAQAQPAGQQTSGTQPPGRAAAPQARPQGQPAQAPGAREQGQRASQESQATQQPGQQHNR